MCRHRYPSPPALILVLFFIASFSAYTFAWDIELVESYVGYDTSAPVVLNSNDIPHAAYFDNNDMDTYASIIHAYRSEGGWSRQTAADDKAETGHSSHPVLALDANDNPYICYRNRSGWLSYIYWTGSNWSSGTIIDSDNRCSPHDAIFDGNDMMNVVYLHYIPDDWEHGQLRLAVDTGGGFDKTVIEPNGNYLSSSIAIDSNNAIHLSYYDDNDELLIYAVQDGNSWTRQEVDSVGDVSSSIDGAIGLALDVNDLPHISYYNFTIGDLKYAHFDGSDWLIQTVDSPNDVGKYSSLALDLQGNPQIAYQNKSNGALKYAAFDGSSWQIELVDDTGSSGKYASLALDSYDRPHISHFDNLNHSVRYAADNPVCGDLQHPILPGDIDENCYIDFNDFSRFASWWLISGCADSNDCQGRDFDETGTVDANDLNTLCSNWLKYTGL